MPAAQSGVWRDALASALTTCLQPGWASSFMVGRRYMRRGSLFRNNAAAKVGLSPFVGAMVKIPFSYPPRVCRWPPKPSCAPIVAEVGLLVTALPHFISSLRQAASIA